MKKKQLAELLLHTAHQNGVDLDGCVTVGAVRGTLPSSLLDGRLLGDGASDPTIRARLDAYDDPEILFEDTVPSPKVLINVRFVVTDGPLKLRVFDEGKLLEERDLNPATAGDEVVELVMDLMTKAGLAPEGT